jgi:hypothetical protein
MIVASATLPGRSPDVEVAEGDQELAAERLQQHEVHVPGPHIVRQLAEIGVEEHLDEGLEDHEHAEQRDRLRQRPAADRPGVAEHGVDHDQSGGESEQRADEVDQQVGAVFQLELERVRHEDAEEGEIAPHAPTAE